MATELTTTASAGAPDDKAKPPTWGEKFAALPLKALLMLGIGASALAAIAIAMSLQGGKNDYRVLFAGLSDKDGGSVIAQLSQMNVPYKHAEGGGAILVPAAQVHDVRMKLGLLGLPKAGTGGYELLDAPKFGQTQAGENVSIKRAIEGELMRTISSLSAVQSARVLLAIPAANGFFREQQKPSASVVVSLHPGRTLDAAQLAGIVHLVSASVPELAPKAVSVVDGSGALLTQQDAANANGLDAQQLKYVHQVESHLQRRLQELLEPVVGRDNLRATVTAEVDFSESLQVSEQYKPNQGQEPAAVRTAQPSESSGGSPATPTGVPGAQSNQPPSPANAPINGAAQQLQPAQSGGGSNNSRRDANTQFEVDKTHRTTRGATGTVKRLSAAVVVNHRNVMDSKGKSTPTALTDAEVEKLTALVEQGIGFSKDRGDTVKVVNAPFLIEEAPKPEALPIWQQPWAQDLLRTAAVPVGLGFVALLIVLTMIRPALKTLNAPPLIAVDDKAPEPGSQLNALVDDTNALPEPGSLASLEAPAPGNDQLMKARALAKDNPAAVANVLRGLMTGEQATT